MVTGGMLQKLKSDLNTPQLKYSRGHPRLQSNCVWALELFMTRSLSSWSTNQQFVRHTHTHTFYASLSSSHNTLSLPFHLSGLKPSFNLQDHVFPASTPALMSALLAAVCALKLVLLHQCRHPQFLTFLVHVSVSPTTLWSAWGLGRMLFTQ